MPHTSTKGFTIVELIVVTTTAAILAGVLFGPLNTLYTSNVDSSRKIVQLEDSHNSLRSIQNLIEQSTGFLASNAIADPSGTSWTGGSTVLVTSNYATTTNTASETTNNLTVAQDAACSTALLNNYVYFLSGTTLYRRTLANTTSSLCGGATIYQQQSCVSTNASTYCKGFDAKIATNVTSFGVQYYANPEDSSTISDPTVASTVVLTIALQNGAGANAISANNSIRVSHIN